MSVLLDHFSIPRKGPVNLNLKRSFTINTTAEEAQKLVHLWLLDKVSCNLGAGKPNLAIGRQSVVWRVPAILATPHLGRVGTAGTVDVDVQSGKMKSLQHCKEKILAGTCKLVDEMPSYIPRVEISDEFIASDLVPTRTEPIGDPLAIIKSFG